MSHDQYYALLSIVFLICVVVLFDRFHNSRLWPKSLLSETEVDRLVRIWNACQES
ncbi:MAG: hypothetical protein JST11_08240 [Acidobacteria bacterium]|nr:hypothetical protein [Acidobacteriota bacterium]